MNWHIVKRLIRAGTLLAVIVVLASLAYVQASGSKLLSVQSKSMVPAIHKGDLVTVTSIPVSHLALGDVITFVNPRNSRQTITHRVVQLPSITNGHKLTTKGDANTAADTPIAASAVIGIVHHKLPYVGFALDFMRRPAGLFLIVYLPALGIVGEELRRLSAYYKSQQPYKLPGRHGARRASAGRRHAKTGLAGVVLCLGLATFVALPARAALMSTATLKGNSISITAQVKHVLIRRVEFECSLDNTHAVNRLPSILFYNPTSKDMPTGGWYLQSSSGRIVTFRPQTVFDAKDDYDIEPDLKAGLNYTGDYLALFNATGHLVDAVNWGSDTTYLHPSLPGIGDGTVFRRLTTALDTDTIADWAVTVEPCSTD
ncbi:MAG: signal peptidase I [Candidatus Saccharimonadales bacterium]